MQTRYCISCGEPFQAVTNEIVFCPNCDGPPEASPEVFVDLTQATASTAHKQEQPVSGSDWQVGDTIINTYEVKHIFTTGGMGLVYRVHHKSWNIDLVMKSPRAEIFSRPGGKESFVREAETWVDLGLHPHIVSCYYVRTIDEFPRVFAEFVESGSLKDWIEDKRLYEGGKDKALERILDIAIQFAWGLAYAHEKGLVHQDVKPANVLMTHDGNAKVSDFGLARARLEAGERVGQVGGGSMLVSSGGYTPAYCSPEQAKGERLSGKTDIWSWGVSILEMFVGEVTWLAGQVANESLVDYLKNGPEDDAIPAMPTELADLLCQCFQIDPNARPKDMQAVATTLQEIYQQVEGQHYLREGPQEGLLAAGSLNNRALSLYELGKIEAARAAWEDVEKDDPAYLEAAYNLGLLRWRAAEITDVQLVTRWKEVSRSAQDKRRVVQLLSQVHLERDDCEAALQVLGELSSQEAGHAQIIWLKRQAEARLPHSGRCLRTFERLSSPVNSVCLSADGRYALSGSEDIRKYKDHTLKLWDTAGGQCVRTYKGHSSYVNSVCLSADGRFVLSGSSDKTLKLWEVASGRCLRTFKGHIESVRSGCLSADGQYVLSGSNDQTLKLWQVSTGRCLRTLEGHTSSVISVCLSTDGRYALSGSGDATLKQWEVASGRCLRTFEGHAGFVNSVCLSADGSLALSGSDDSTLKLWEISSGRCLRTFVAQTYDIERLRPDNPGVNSVCLSADGRYALSSKGGEIPILQLWEVPTGRCLRTFEGHTTHDYGDGVRSVYLSADGCYALSGGVATLRLWRMAFGTPASLELVQCTTNMQAYEGAQTLREAQQALQVSDWRYALDRLQCLLNQPGLERLAQGRDLWSQLSQRLPHTGLHDGWLLRTFKGHTNAVTSVCLSADGRYALSGSYDKTLKLWEAVSGYCLHTFEGHTEAVASVCLSADGRLVCSGSADGTLKLWEIASGRCMRTFVGHTYGVTCACLSADGRYVLSGSGDSTLKLWEVVSGRCLRTFEGHERGVGSVCLSADGRYILSGSADDTLKLWEVTSGHCLRTFKGNTYVGISVCLSVDGRYALSGSFDHTLKLWDLASGSCLSTFKGHTWVVASVCLSADGCFALSGSSDQTLKLWEVSSGHCLRTFVGHTDIVSSICLSTDGRYALSGSYDYTLKLWELDWELENHDPADWDDGARMYLKNFIILHSPCGGTLPQGRTPTDEEITLALTRHGKPTWTEEDFQRLLYTLGCAGFGWLRPEGVRTKLEEMAAEMGIND